MGDVWSPRIAQIEALSAEAKYFVDCVENDKQPFNDAKAGLEIVKILAAANESLSKKRRDGVPMTPGSAGIPPAEYCCIAPDVKMGAM